MTYWVKRYKKFSFK